jgi:hypothetical protein
MRDSQPVELRRQPGQRHLELDEAHPPGLEQAPADARSREAPEKSSGAVP